MTPFPIMNDKVQLTVTAVDPTDAFLSALRLKADDSAVRAATVGTAYYCAGLPFTATGQLVYVDSTAGLPANTTYVNGLPISPAGALCVSTGATVGYSNGVPFTANGSVAGGSYAAQVAAIMAGFAGPKVQYDPTNVATLFQDSAGTTPVTTAGQQIGKILDISGANNHATQATPASAPLWQTSYASFDGVNDWWQTASINFTSTDKATIVAGVRRLSDAADGVIYMLSSTNANNGMFWLKGPGSGTATKFEFLSRGTAQSIPFTSSATYDAPISAVATGVTDIAAPVATLRLNGTQVDSKVVTQGTGTFGNWPLFVGMQNGASLPFNGNLFGLVIIGRLLTPSELYVMEHYMAEKAGAVLP